MWPLLNHKRSSYTPRVTSQPNRNHSSNAMAAPPDHTRSSNPPQAVPQPNRKRPRPSPSPSPSDQGSTHPEYMCTCHHPPPTFIPNHYYICRHCLHHQHIPCALGPAEPESEPTASRLHPRCNRCEASHLRRLLAHRRAEVERMKTVLAETRQETEELYEVTLWAHYCNLPNVDSTPRAVVEVTGMRFAHAPPDAGDYEEGSEVEGAAEIVPMNAAPQPWVEEVVGNVTEMLAAAGSRMVEEFARECRVFEEGNERVLRPWREMAVHMLHRGEVWVGQRHKLGMLAEVLGLEEKGTYWRRWIQESENEEEDGGEIDVEEETEGGDEKGEDWEDDDYQN